MVDFQGKPSGASIPLHEYVSLYEDTRSLLDTDSMAELKSIRDWLLDSATKNPQTPEQIARCVAGTAITLFVMSACGAVKI